MALIIRIDVDRPYGRHPFIRHFLSRLSSDLYLPRVAGFGFLAELHTMLAWLNEAGARAHVFFRRCTLPFRPVLEMLETGGHEVGLHLENSRSLETFLEEKEIMERHFGRRVTSVSKHGSGGAKYGYHHYAPYEPEKYADWARQSQMRLFLGNLEDPGLEPANGGGLTVFPSAFWLEPAWRDIAKFPVEWLLDSAKHRDIVLLVHPENVLADAGLVADFKRLIKSLETRVFP
jgi:hypothetical protein